MIQSDLLSKQIHLIFESKIGWPLEHYDKDDVGWNGSRVLLVRVNCTYLYAKAPLKVLQTLTTTMSKMTSFTSLCKELRENILDSFDLTELSSLTGVTPTLHTGVDEYIQRHKHIIFAHFMSNIKDFVGLLQGTGSVVSGSCALNLVQARQGAVAINDLDIYTTMQNFDEFMWFFMETEHYTIIRDFHQPPLVLTTPPAWPKSSGCKTTDETWISLSPTSRQQYLQYFNSTAQLLWTSFLWRPCSVPTLDGHLTELASYTWECINRMQQT